MRQQILELKSRKHIEWSLQCACVEWFDKQYPFLSQLFFHIPNEGKRSPKAGKHLQMIGKRAGIWDSFLSVPKKIDDVWFHGAYYEFKPDRKSHLSHVQLLFGAQAFNNSYSTQVIFELDEFVEHVKWYLSGFHVTFPDGRSFTL